MEIPGNVNTKLGAVQVNMVDYKFAVGKHIRPADLKDSKDKVRDLLDSLRRNTTFIPIGKDKTIAAIELKSRTIVNELSLILGFNKPEDLYPKLFNLPLPPAFRHRKVKNLDDALRGMCRVDPGGNVPNMIRNMAHIMASHTVPQDMTIDLYSTKESLFLDWFHQLPKRVQERINLTLIDLPSRKGLHLPYNQSGGKEGTLGIGTPLLSTIDDMRIHMKNLLSCNHVLVSESLYSLTRNKRGKEDYREFQNPSTAFREQCASQSYNHVVSGGMHIPFVAMNDEEIMEYIISLEKRRSAPGTQNDQALSFASPFNARGTLSTVTVRQVTDAFYRYLACITPRIEATLQFPLSVSCGVKGGFHVAYTPKGKRFVIFTTTPQSSEGGQRMLGVIGKNSDIFLGKRQVMGAGDAVATVLSLAHMWDIPALLRKHAKSKHPHDERFIETAAIVFISLLSRLTGEMVFHSDRCDWSSVPHGKFPNIIRVVAEKALDAATQMWGHGHTTRQTRDAAWDINIAMWQI